MTEPDSIQERLRKSGYSQEDEYFYKLNRELIEQRRRQLDAQRSALKTRHEASPHWMRCPKCSGTMREIDLLGVKIDMCTRCEGLFFDKGELALVSQSSEPEKYVHALGRDLLVAPHPSDAEEEDEPLAQPPRSDDNDRPLFI